MNGEEKVVCVTGASGYIASWLVKLLLATVRDPMAKNKPWKVIAGPDTNIDIKPYPEQLLRQIKDDTSKIKHLHALDGAKERLLLFKANLLEEGSFDSAVNGCEGVFHTASPVIISSNDPQAELIDSAVKGTLNVLRSCEKVQSIRRVVVTSSMASVYYNGNPLTADVVVDETWFSNPVLCKESNHWYHISKTLAEEAAWKFAKENGIDLVTLHPGFVIGPFLQSMLNFSVEVILNIINGAQTFPSPYRLFDVRDVAYAHNQALEVPIAWGRYWLVERVTQLCEILKILHEHYPTLHLQEKFKAAKYEPTYQISKERAKSLGMDFRPWEVSIKDTVESWKEKGFLNV